MCRSAIPYISTSDFNTGPSSDERGVQCFMGFYNSPLLKEGGALERYMVTFTMSILNYSLPRRRAELVILTSPVNEVPLFFFKYSPQTCPGYSKQLSGP